MRRLLVTGQHGFVGKTLARLMAIEPSLASWELAPLSEQFQILDLGAVRGAVEAAAPDAVLHLAALPPTRRI